MHDIFLLSPAYCGGKRAQMLTREGSDMVLARQLRSGKLTLGAAFSFMSGLYFRGKQSYADTFESDLYGSFVITPTRGLARPDLQVSRELLLEFAEVDVDADDQRYRSALERDAGSLSSGLPPDARVILLGSIATGKYVDVLMPVFGDRLHYPVEFVGRGDMSRGGLMLRSARAGLPLKYARVTSVRPRSTRPVRPVRLMRIGSC